MTEQLAPHPRGGLYFEDFVEATVGHFHSLVNRYSIWNEPNHDGWLRPSAEAPRLYRSLYVAGHGAIKAADRRATVPPRRCAGASGSPLAPSACCSPPPSSSWGRAWTGP